MATFELTPVQGRVLAALVEKSMTTPQYYPLTVNALVNACNQKSARDPVMSLTQGEVGSALLDLQELDLVAETSDGGRVPKWRQRMKNQLLLQAPTQGVLTALLLRGPQTPAELRANANGLGGPDSAAAVLEALEDLADRAQSLVRQLPKGAGQKEARWAQLLTGEEVVAAWLEQSPVPRTSAPSVNLLERIEALEARVAALEAASGQDAD